MEHLWLGVGLILGFILWINTQQPKE